MQKNYFYIAVITLSTLLLSLSCSREDDIDEIFHGRTWYMNGLVVNGIPDKGDEVKTFYGEEGTGIYYITFSAQTFRGTLSSGTNISGTWSANGKHQTIKLMLDPIESLIPFDQKLYNILRSVSSYSSGADFIQLKDNNKNVIMFGSYR